MAAAVFLATVAAAEPFRSALYPEDWQPGFSGTGGAFLHDFSHAGYKNGEVPVPDPPSGPVFDVASYGADATGASDATGSIQSAINAAQTAGGGVVWFPAGLYRCDGILLVTHSNIALQGAGAGLSRIYFTQCAGMDGKAHLVFQGIVARGADVPLAADGQNGASSVLVADSSGLAVGDDIAVGWVITPDFVAEHNMTGTWQVSVGQWRPIFRRTVTAVDNSVTPHRVTLDVPLRYPAKLRDSASLRRETGHISECGISDLGLSNAVAYLEAWTIARQHLLRFEGAKDCWALRLESFASPLAADTRGLHLQNSGLHVLNAKRVTVADCRLEKAQNRGGGGCGYLYELGTSGELLLRDCKGLDGRHNFIQNWDFGTTGCVFLRCQSAGGKNVISANSSLSVGTTSEYHHELAMACLVDSCTLDDGWSAVNRGTESSGAGLTSTQCVVWNAHGAGMIRSMQSGLGYVIGTEGTSLLTSLAFSIAAGSAPEDWVEGQNEGRFLCPSSLYDDQLARRLGGVAETQCGDCACQSALFEGEWTAFADLWGLQDPDVPVMPGSIVPERWTLAMVSEYLCRQGEANHDAVENAYFTNLSLLQLESSAVRAQTGPFIHLLAALLAVSPEMRGHLAANFALTGDYQTTAGEPFSASGDADGDGHDNGEEYESIRAAGGGMQDYVNAAMSPRIVGDSPLPAAGTAALVLLAVALALVPRLDRSGAKG
jgi:hypothetical protein